jgi:hypothetical protein
MQKVISFDIGIKNLAYCVFLHDLSSNPVLAWDVLDISRECGPKEEDGEKMVAESLTCTCSLVSKKKEKETCKKKAKYRNKTGDLFCEKHAKEKKAQGPRKKNSQPFPSTQAER